jgi:bifunctional non-homologous end joining protein LigD
MLKAASSADAVWQSNREPKPDAPARLAAAPKMKAARAPKKAAAKTDWPPRGAKRAAMPDFIPPELCRLATAAPAGPGWGHEVKFDGYRLQLRLAKGRVKLLTRKGLDWTERFPALAREAAALADCIVDGELVAYGAKGEPSFDALQAAIAEKRTDDLAYFAFDLLFAEGYDLRPLPLRARKAHLEARIADAGPIIRYTTHIEGSGPDVIAAACEMGLEGIVSKRLDAPYRSARTEAWVKTKCRRSESVVIGGWLEEDGRFRSLLAGAPEGKGLRYIGKVGTGFGRAAVERLLPALKSAAADSSPFVSGPAPKRGARWAEPRLVAEVEFAAWTHDGLLRQAAYKGLREDLSPSDVRLGADAAADPAPAPMPARVRTPGTLKVQGVSISSSDKVLWPATEESPAFTKADLAAYFEAIGDWMLYHIKGRPCSIVRAPDGIEGETFFQRHANKGSPALFTRTKVSGEKEPYLQIDTLEALIAAAQLGGVELHPWNCEPGNPETPGRLIFDLDPAPDVAFDRVVEAAKELSDRLADLGLETFCKTTGGKGLHVVTPFAPTPRQPAQWPEAKAFAQEVCRRMASDAPDRYLIVMTKAKRTGRIYLDYLRNDRTATAVAPLSPRARAGAPVSMPLNWAQVRKGLDPRRYTLATAAAALAKGKPWGDYADAGRPFREAARKLGSR